MIIAGDGSTDCHLVNRWSGDRMQESKSSHVYATHWHRKHEHWMGHTTFTVLVNDDVLKQA